MLKVLIADSSNLTAERFKAILSDIANVSVVGLTVSGKKTLSSVKELGPDLILLDQSISGGGGIEILRGIKEHSPLILVMMLLDFESVKYHDKLKQSGADFVFFKSTEVREITEAVTRLAMPGGTS